MCAMYDDVEKAKHHPAYNAGLILVLCRDEPVAPTDQSTTFNHVEQERLRRSWHSRANQFYGGLLSHAQSSYVSAVNTENGMVADGWNQPWASFSLLVPSAVGKAPIHPENFQLFAW